MKSTDRQLLSGDEAIALAALHAGVALGTGYPGTPSTEILEDFSQLGGRAQWAPNEKVALEVGLGVAFAGARALVTMKHVGLNVAADPLFTAAYTGVTGALVVVSADDPGMASSQNEQDNRRYAVAAGVPMLEPADSQEAYDFTSLALEISERWGIPVLLRLTTRVCHSKTVVRPARRRAAAARRRISSATSKARVMIPAYARPAHRRLRRKAGRNRGMERSRRAQPGNRRRPLAGDYYLRDLVHARPRGGAGSGVLKLGMTYPLPLETIRRFVAERRPLRGDRRRRSLPARAIRAAGMQVEGKPEMFRFGELNVDRVRRILAGDASPGAGSAAGKAAGIVPGLPAPRRLHGAAQPGLHRGQRHRLLHAGRAAALRGHGHAASAWERASAWGWACGTRCRLSRPAAWSA